MGSGSGGRRSGGSGRDFAGELSFDEGSPPVSRRVLAPPVEVGLGEELVYTRSSFAFVLLFIDFIFRRVIRYEFNSA